MLRKKSVGVSISRRVSAASSASTASSLRLMLSICGVISLKCIVLRLFCELCILVFQLRELGFDFSIVDVVG